MKTSILILMLLVYAGCDKKLEPIKEIQTNNSNYAVSLLFETEGCKIYKFYDQWQYRYFANCVPGVFGGHTEMVGKTLRYVNDSIPTDKK